MKRCVKHIIAIFVKSVILAFSFLIVICAHSFAQDVNGKNSIDEWKEYALLHVAQTGYLSGETIWFKVYVIHHKTGRLSPLSKIAYVELVNKDGTSVLQQKIEIEHGVGNGSWSIPEKITSGTYQIRCYVSAQKNIPETIYSSSIHIFNPYLLPVSLKEKSQISVDLNGSIKAKEESNGGFSMTKKDGLLVSGVRIFWRWNRGMRGFIGYVIFKGIKSFVRTDLYRTCV